jgi:4-hydroxymandelate oxidase
MSFDGSPPLVSLADYERVATEQLGEQAASYIFGGAGEEITLRDNVAAWRRLALLPRMLVGAGPAWSCWASGAPTPCSSPPLPSSA